MIDNCRIQVACTAALGHTGMVDGDDSFDFDIGHSTSIAQAARAASGDSTCPVIPSINGIEKLNGGLLANSPVKLANGIAKQLWPDSPVDALLVVGAGRHSEPLAQAKEDVLRQGTQSEYIFSQSRLQVKQFKAEIASESTFIRAVSPKIKRKVGLHVRKDEDIQYLREATQNTLKEKGALKEVVGRLFASMFFVELF